MRAWKLLALASVLLVTTAMAGCPYNPDEQRNVSVLTLAEACEAYAGALRVLTPRKSAGLLSPEEIARVDQLNQSTDMVCTGPPPADPVDAVARVSNAVTTVMLIAANSES